MADLSTSFDPGAIATASDAASSALAVGSDASSKASDALSKIAAKSATWDKASAASSAVVVVQSAASDAASAAAAAASKASDVSSALVKHKRVVVLKPYNEASAIATGDGKMYFTVPSELSGMNLVTIGAHLYTAGSGLTQIQIANVTSAVDMLTSKAEIDTGEKDTVTATSAAVINTGADGVAEGEELRIDIDAAASGAKGLEVRLGFQKP